MDRVKNSRLTAWLWRHGQCPVCFDGFDGHGSYESVKKPSKAVFDGHGSYHTVGTAQSAESGVDVSKPGYDSRRFSYYSQGASTYASEQFDDEDTVSSDSLKKGVNNNSYSSNMDASFQKSTYSRPSVSKSSFSGSFRKSKMSDHGSVTKPLEGKSLV